MVSINPENVADFFALNVVSLYIGFSKEVRSRICFLIITRQN